MEKKKYNICIVEFAVGKLVQTIPRKIGSRMPNWNTASSYEGCIKSDPQVNIYHCSKSNSLGFQFWDDPYLGTISLIPDIHGFQSLRRPSFP